MAIISVTKLSRNVHGLVGWVRARRCYLLAMGKRILIVDDEPEFSELVQYRLGAATMNTAPPPTALTP
jgi:hypothetical protein